MGLWVFDAGLLTGFLLGLGYVWPAYVSNATPVVAVKLLGKAHPLDLGATLPDGRRVLGDGKTVEGLVSGVSTGFAVGVAMHTLLPFLFRDLLEILLISSGALAGDILGAFIKRRLGIKQGAPAPILDQLGFLAVSLLTIHLTYGLPSFITPSTLTLLLLFTLLMHIGTNTLAYLLGLKDTWY